MKSTFMLGSPSERLFCVCVCLVSGGFAGALQAGWDQLHGPGLWQGGELCEGKRASWVHCASVSEYRVLEQKAAYGTDQTAVCMFKSLCVFVSRSNPSRRTDSPKSGFLSQTWRTTSSRSVGTNFLRKEATGKEADLLRGSSDVCIIHLGGGCWTVPLCASREISESMALQNPKGSLLTSSGILFSLFLLEPTTLQ